MAKVAVFVGEVVFVILVVIVLVVICVIVQKLLAHVKSHSLHQ